MNIEKRLQASKSLSKLHQKGLTQEVAVIKHLQEINHQILFHRLRTIFIEVDIVSLSAAGVLSLIEVKSSRPEQLFSSLQLEKLLSLQNTLLEHELDVELLLSYPINGKIQLERVEL